MAVARVLVEQPESLIVVPDVATQVSAIEERAENREALFIVSIAIVIAFTFTVMVIGSILIALALRGTGVMGTLGTQLVQLSC